jgi:uncharacterized iron-regulated membrane protein
MNTRTVRAWVFVHRWSSLICTLFMLLLCLTGLPLIFNDEIDHWLHEVPAKKMPPTTPKASVDRVIDAAKARHPQLALQYLSIDPKEPEIWLVSLAADPSATENVKSVLVDSRTAEVLGEPRFDEGFMHWMLRLHVDLFAGLPGTLFLGLMGLLLLAAIVSGIVLYAPFMRKLNFGVVRSNHSARLRWLDLHNLLGIVTFMWLAVVGVTGVINTLGQPAIKIWQSGQLKTLTAGYENRQALPAKASVDAAVNAASRTRPDLDVAFVAFPGTPLTSQFHYGVYLQGREAFSSRLFSPVLVDTQTGAVTASGELAWYVKTILLSQPFHFGNYGGLLMKIIWALLDIVTIIVLCSGLYLWWRKPSQSSGTNTKAHSGDTVDIRKTA